ncbi:HAMP domain-containing sensor histidine kinase [Sphingomonas sp. 10B4]|uniref:sensor histidine kinase n=1 Tax=Sphingomonas sp. 10B4 TaxID=3048575 RepID=UPI002AB489D9|nr:HAMP domain-containing sensor histidine kinase [Sphingomonas sp. 10B4]MDY7523137.1 HAMP domain-containing sensor histidine kinase [Sphingomonas sp. 10B4]MEB0284462.1 HAMP domain-containing sensor histidine kinase [Sphingomonas sp. 10B4]
MVGRLAALSIVAMVVGFAGLVIKAYRIAHGLSDEGQADVFVEEFMMEAAWSFPLFAAVVLATVVVTVRTSLAPLKQASDRASRIDPTSPGVRLDNVGVPSELLSLVAAINEALERLERGFETQRRFTGDAAHELRTPLAILTSGLEALPESDEVRRLRQDVMRMTRLVEQLLRIARLDALPLDTRPTVDLGEIVTTVVEQLAPWAVGLGCTIALEPPPAPIVISGDADALASAVRNLIENAVHHTLAGTEVIVAVNAPAQVRVIDHGPGIPEGDRANVFSRFWRAPGQARTGAGLGLAIVAQVAQAHRGSIRIEDGPQAGANFVLNFKPSGQ